MINSKRLSKLKKELIKVYKIDDPKKFIIKVKEGLFLYDLNINPIENSQRVKINKAIKGIHIEDLSNNSIDELVVVSGEGYHLSVIIDDIEGNLEGSQVLKDYFNEANILNYSDLSREQLIELSDLEYM